MRRRPRPWDSATQVAAGAALLSVLALGWSARGAIAIEPLPAAMPTTRNGAPDRPGSRSLASIPSDTGVIAAAVAANPFSPDRRPAETPFTLDAEPGENALGPSPSDRAGQLPIVFGIAQVRGGDAVVLASYPGIESRVLRLGESLGGWTLTHVDANAAGFRSQHGEEVAVEMPQP